METTHYVNIELDGTESKQKLWDLQERYRREVRSLIDHLLVPSCLDRARLLLDGFRDGEPTRILEILEELTEYQNRLRVIGERLQQLPEEPTA